MITNLVVRLLQHHYRLTKREVEILELVLAGSISTTAISTQLKIAESTVNKYIESLSRKLGFKSRSSLLAGLLHGMSSTMTPVLYPNLKEYKPRVAIMDDDQDISEYLSGALVEHGFNAFAVTNIETPAVEIRNANIDVLICDLIMPGEDGIKLARSLFHGMPAGPSVVLITGYPDLVDRYVNESTRGVIASVLFKPLDIDELVSVVWAATIVCRMRGFLVDPD